MDASAQAQAEQTSKHARVAWCFTLNNPTITKEEMLELLNEDCKYVVIGDEIGEEGTPHFQGYLELKRKKRFQQVKQMFLDLSIDQNNQFKPHLEPRRGTPLQASDYCKEDGNFVEFGELAGSNQGKRSDLDRLTGMLIEKSHMRSVALESPATWVRNYRGLIAFQDLIADPPREIRPDLQVHLYYGKTGTGKTWKAIHDNPGIYKKPVGKAFWFDGLPQGCKAVLLDECAGQFPLTDLLQITDIYKTRVEVKGGHTFLDVDTIIMTANSHPATWYPGKPPNDIPYYGREEQGLALLRRFTKILWFRTRDEVVEIDDHVTWWRNYSAFL